MKYNFMIDIIIYCFDSVTDCFMVHDKKRGRGMSCTYIPVEVGVLFLASGPSQTLTDNEAERLILSSADIYHIFIIFVILVTNIYLLFMRVIDFIHRSSYENMGIDKFS